MKTARRAATIALAAALTFAAAPTAHAAGPAATLNPNPYCALAKKKPSAYSLDSRVWAAVFRPFCDRPVPRIPYGGR